MQIQVIIAIRFILDYIVATSFYVMVINVLLGPNFVVLQVYV